MTRSVFDPGFEELPETLPIFPLSGALVLPRGQLPLNIFEPRYLNMVRDALAGDRMIGMIQPCAEKETQDPGDAPEVYRTGCAGRLISFSETDDGRFLITLKGVARFDVGEELPLKHGYRRVVPLFERYRGDLDEEEGEIDRPALLEALGEYLNATGMQGDWTAIKEAPDEPLVTWLSMGCPFEPPEKQALLEAETLTERATTILTLLRMASLEQDGGPAHH